MSFVNIFTRILSISCLDLTQGEFLIEPFEIIMRSVNHSINARKPGTEYMYGIPLVLALTQEQCLELKRKPTIYIRVGTRFM